MSLYNVTKEIKRTARALADVHTITIGDFWEIDQLKQAKYPLLHIVPSDSPFTIRENGFSMRLILVDQMKGKFDPKGSTILDPTLGDDDLEDILANLHLGLTRMMLDFWRGTAYDNGVYLKEEDVISANAFIEEFGNVLAGWSADVTFYTKGVGISDGHC